MAEATTEIVSRLRLDRESWAGDLQSAKSQMTEFVQGLSAQRLTIPLAVDLSDVTAKLNAWRLEQESRPVRIPVEMVPAGGGLGAMDALRQEFAAIRNVNAVGGGWGGRMASIMPGGGGDEMFGGFGGGGLGAGGPVYNTYNTVNSVTGAAAAGIDRLAPNRYVPNYFTIAEVADEMDRANQAVPTAAAAGRGLRGTSGLASGMAGRMMLMELARAPIEHAVAEYEAVQKLDQANAMGSAADSRRAMIASLQADSSGVTGFLTDALGGTDYAGQARDLIRQGGAIADRDIVLQAQQRGRLADLRTAAYESADPYARRGYEREAQYQQAVAAANQRAKTDIDAHNFAGRRAEVERQYQEEYAKATLHSSEPGDITPDMAAQEERRQAAAEAARQARLRAIANDERAINEARDKEIAQALADKNAGLNEDVAARSIRGIESGLRIQSGHIAAGEALSRATGGDVAASDRAYEQRIRAEIQALNEKAAALEKVGQEVDKVKAKELRDEAQGKSQDLATELRARSYQRAAAIYASDEQAMGVESGNRALAMRLGGDALGASREEIRAQIDRERNALNQRGMSGELTPAQFQRGLADLNARQSLMDQGAERDDRLRNMRLDSAVTESGIVSPYARQRQRIADQIAEQRLANPGHDAQYDTLAGHEVANLDREHGQSIALMRAGAAAMTLRAQGRTAEANNLEAAAREDAEFANAAGDPEMQSAVRQKFQAERNLRNMPHFHQTTSREIYMGAIEAALMSGYAANMPGIGAKASAANPGMGQPIGAGRPPGGGQFPPGALGETPTDSQSASNHPSGVVYDQWGHPHQRRNYFPPGGSLGPHAAARDAINHANSPPAAAPFGAGNGGNWAGGAAGTNDKFKDAVDKMYDTFQNPIQIYIAPSA